MEPLPLKLTMVQGPREGETLTFRPGSTVRIGRVVRGNNLSIKDDGISSKHLVIVSDSGKWIIQDLESSNGTILNSSTLSPFKSVDLCDGDTIKLGEYTSILVQINGQIETSQLRRNPRRRVNDSSKVVPVAENRSRLDGVVKDENDEKLEEKSELKVVQEIRRRGRPRRARVLESVEEKPEEVKKANVRITRSRKNENCVVAENLEVGCGEVGKKTRGGRGRRKNAQEVPMETLPCDVVHDKENTDLGLNSREQVKQAVKEEKIEIAEEEQKKEGVGLGKESENVVNGDVDKVGDGMEEGIDGSANLGKGKELPALEKMTLEDWFDHMEVDLPKEIIKVTEEMIEGMRRKAEQVREYMIEQKKNKGVRVVG